MAALICSAVQRNHSPRSCRTPLMQNIRCMSHVASHVAVGEGCAVVTDGVFFQHDAVGRRPRAYGGVLLGDLFLHALGGVAHLERALVLRMHVLLGVDFGRNFGSSQKKVFAAYLYMHIIFGFLTQLSVRNVVS